MSSNRSVQKCVNVFCFGFIYLIFVKKAVEWRRYLSLLNFILLIMKTQKRILFLIGMLVASLPYLDATQNNHDNKAKHIDDSTHQQNLFFAELPKAKQIALLQGYLKRNNLDMPYVIQHIIFPFVFIPPLNSRGARYQGKNFVGFNLSGRDFTSANLERADCSKAILMGSVFKSTNVTDAFFDNAILTHTICDYQAHFQDNMKANKIRGGEWYQNNLPNDLKSIAKVYPQLKKDADKAELLHIACSLARLPYDDQDPEFYVKVAYWSCKLLCLKNRLSKDLGDQLVCSLTKGLNYDANNFCWKTEYPQDKITCAQTVNLPQGKPDFAGYLKQFNDGLKQYKVQSKDEWGFNWYKNNIEKNIQGIAKAYPKVEDRSLQKEMLETAYKLSKSYELQHAHLLFHFLYHQNLLIRIRESVVGVETKNDIHYNFEILLYLFTAGLEYGPKMTHEKMNREKRKIKTMLHFLLYNHVN